LLVLTGNPADARLIAQQLEDESQAVFEIRTADRLETAQPILDEGQTDVVLLDLSLPDSSGMSSLEAILERYPQVAIVALTGVDDAEQRAEIIRRGAQDCLPKSILSSAALSRAVRFAYERKSRENEQLRGERDLLLLSRLPRDVAEAPPLESALQRRLDDGCATSGWTTGAA